MTDRIERSIDIAAPPSKVWAALADADVFGKWFRVAFDGPFVLGQTTCGRLLYPGFERHVFELTTVTIEPESRFAFTWHPYAVDLSRDYSAEPETRVEFTLAPADGGTRITVVETGFAALPPDRQPDAIRMNTSGWTEQLDNLRVHVGG